MAYYLLVPNTTANTRVDLDGVASIPETASGNFEIEFELEILGSEAIICMGATSGDIVFFTNLTNLQSRIGGTQRNFTLPQSAADRHIYKIVSSVSAGNIEIFQDGVSVGTIPGDSFYAIEWILNLNNSTSRHWGLYYFLVRNSSGTVIHHYDPSASNGTGSILPDIVGTVDGILENFPTDDSQWVFYAAGGGDSATTIGLESSSEVGTPSVGQNHSVTTSAIESASSVGTPAVGQNHSLSTTGIESASTVGTPAAGSVAGVDSATTSPIESASKVATPSVGQNHSLTTTGIESSSVLGTPSAGLIANNDSATTAGLESASSVGTPAVSQIHVISTDGIESAAVTGQPGVGQNHILSSTGIESLSTLGTPVSLGVSGLLLGIKPSITTKITAYSIAKKQPVQAVLVSQSEYTIQVNEPNYTVIQ